MVQNVNDEKRLAAMRAHRRAVSADGSGTEVAIGLGILAIIGLVYFFIGLDDLAPRQRGMFYFAALVGGGTTLWGLKNRYGG